MVPAAMEIHIGDMATKESTLEGAPVDLRKALFQPVPGMVEFDDNTGGRKQSNLAKARQMQTVEIEGGGHAATGLFIKLILKRNHVDK